MHDIEWAPPDGRHRGAHRITMDATPVRTTMSATAPGAPRGDARHSRAHHDAGHPMLRTAPGAHCPGRTHRRPDPLSRFGRAHVQTEVKGVCDIGPPRGAPSGGGARDAHHRLPGVRYAAVAHTG
ncbi:hypothetical protein E7X58_37790 [Streptomyces sp. A1499]|nr:hypothetical protein E7X58_37790 [Streptomyces sp. A1499]